MRWLLLDLGGVLELVDDDAWPDALAARWAGEVGLTPQKFRAELRTLDLPRTDLVAGTEAAYWRSIGDHFALPSVHLQRWRNEFWDAYCGTLNTELFAVVRSLRGTCGLAVLSNSGDGAREQEEARFALSDVFSPICYSHEIGHNKPDPEAFVAALSAMNARPEAVLFIDDRPTNIDAACAQGMGAHCHTNNADTIAAIERFLNQPAMGPDA